MFSSTYFFALVEDCFNLFLYTPMWYFTALMFAFILIGIVRKIFHII